MALNPLDRVVRDVADIKRQLAGRSQLNHSSLEDTAIPVYDGDGTERLRIGAQDDGTHSVKYVQGPPPPRPTAPVVSVDGPVVRVRWDGILMGGHIPEDFARIDVHFALASDDLEDQAAVKGSLATVAGNETVLAATQTGTYRVGLVAVSQSRARSEMSDTVEVDVTLVDIEGALNEVIDNAQGGKNHYTPTKPGPGGPNDLWFDTSEDEDGLVHYTPHRWDGQQWVSIGDQRTQAIQNAQREFEQSTSQALSDVQQAASGAQSAADAATEAAGTALSTAETARDEAEAKANAAQAAAEAHAEAVAEAERLAAIAEASDDASAKAAAAEAAAKAEAAQDASAKAAAAQAAAEAKAQAAQDAADAAQSSADDARSRADAAHSAAGSAADAADAAMQAATHNAKNMWSTENPSGTAPRGTIWFKIDPATKNVVGQWQQTAGSDTSFGSNWEKRSLTDALFDNIDAGKIGTGYLDVAKLIRAGAITTSLLGIGDFTNYIRDLNLSAARTAFNAISYTGQYPMVERPDISPGGEIAPWVWQQVLGVGRATRALADPLSVTPGEKMYVSFDARRNGAASPLRLNLWVQDSQGNNVAWDAFASQAPASAPDGEWRSYSGIVTIPTGGFRVVPQWKRPANGDMQGGWFMANPVVRRMVGGTLIEPGAINTPHLAAGSITGESGILANLDAGVITYGFMSGARLESGSVDTPQLAFGAATGDVLAVDALNFKTARGLDIVSSSFRAGDTVEITEENGFRQYGPDGALLVSFPTDGSRNRFGGEVEATQFTATGSMSIQGPGQIAAGGQLQIESGVTAPATSPSVSATYDQQQLPPLADGDRAAHGLTRAGGLWWRWVEHEDPDASDRGRLEGINDSMEIVVDAGTGDRLGRNGLTAIGSELFMLGPKTGDNTTRWVTTYTTSGTFVREWQYVEYGSGTYQPGVGRDEAGNLLIAQCGGTGYYRHRVYNKATGAVTGQVDGPDRPRSDFSSIYVGAADFGATRIVVGKAFKKENERQFVVYTANAQEFIREQSWYTPGRTMALAGFCWADGRFHSLTGSSTLTAYEPFDTAVQGGDESGDWWMSHTWASGSSETPASAATRFAWPTRARVRVTIQAPPRGADRAHLYLGRGPATPARAGLHRVHTATTTTVLPPVPTSWQTAPTPPATNTFTDDTPGIIRSVRDGFEVRGDGSGHWGPLTFHPDGSMTSDTVPEWVPITDFATGFGPQTWGDVPSYRIWPDGKVEWRGVVAGPMADTMEILTIPNDALPGRPKNKVAATNTSTTSDGMMRIEFGPNTAQTALRVYPSGANRTWLSIDELYYYLDSE